MQYPASIEAEATKERRGRLGRWLAAAGVLFAIALIPVSSAWSIGLLIPNEPELPPLAVKSHRVKIDITDQAAVTRVEQVFVNHTNRQLEATFVFPLPPGSTVSDFSLWIGGRKTKGTVLEKDKARETYERIVRRTQDPGLVEYMDGTLFRASIFPVPANGEQKVEIAYASVMEQVGGMRRLLYPLKTGRSAAKLMQDFTVVADISSKAPLKTIYSPSHRIDVNRKSDHKAQVSVEESAADLERDFQLYMSTGADDVGLSLLTYDEDGEGGDPGYFLMILAPRLEINEDRIPSKTVTFVVDASGSMIGEKMNQARDSLKYCLQKLRREDKFNVVRFSTGVEPLFSNPQKASKANIAKGLAFANSMEAAGGTAINDALTQALGARTGDDKPHFVIFMTDGRPTVGNTNIREIIANASKNNTDQARLFTFGVGYDVNTTLLDKIAADNDGTADYVRPNEDIELKVTGLYNRIAYPVMTDLKLDYGTDGVYDVYPQKLPDLFRGGQVVVMGRYRQSLPSKLRLGGTLGAQSVTLEFSETASSGGDEATKAHDFIPKLWGTRKVGYLLEEIRTNGERSELKNEVIRLARKYGLVTPYTSYLAVDDSEFEERPPRRPRDPHRHPVPNARLRGGGGTTDAEPAEESSQDYDFGGDKLEGQLAQPNSSGIRSRAREKKRRRARSLAKKKSLNETSGKDAVESSLATGGLKQAESAEDSAALGTRYVDGVLFVKKSGVWRQDGLEAKGAVRIKYLSKAYFNLLKAHPQLKRRISLGAKVLLKVGGKTVLIGPSGKESLSIKTLRSW